MNITRRSVLLGASAAAATVATTAPLAIKAAGVKAALASTRPANPLREGVQALVNEIRQGLDPNVTAASHFALHQAADRLEALPGKRLIASMPFAWP